MYSYIYIYKIARHNLAVFIVAFLYVIVFLSNIAIYICLTADNYIAITVVSSS